MFPPAHAQLGNGDCEHARWPEATLCGTSELMKIDFKKTLDSYRAKSGEIRILDVPPRRYLMIDGHGDPNTAPAYSAAIAALFPVAYAMKFASKKDLGKDYVVTPLEALWWASDMEFFTARRDKSQWNWTVMIMVPDWIDTAMFDAALASVAKKRPPVDLERIRLESLHEGQCVQTLHIGSYDDETDTLAEMHDNFIPGAGMHPTGKHHEIYLSDPRRVDPSELRTILRQPVGSSKPSLPIV